MQNTEKIPVENLSSRINEMFFSRKKLVLKEEEEELLYSMYMEKFSVTAYEKLVKRSLVDLRSN